MRFSFFYQVQFALLDETAWIVRTAFRPKTVRQDRVSLEINGSCFSVAAP
jgi:hypothetical protein